MHVLAFLQLLAYNYLLHLGNHVLLSDCELPELLTFRRYIRSPSPGLGLLCLQASTRPLPRHRTYESRTEQHVFKMGTEALADTIEQHNDSSLSHAAENGQAATDK